MIVDVDPVALVANEDIGAAFGQFTRAVTTWRPALDVWRRPSRGYLAYSLEELLDRRDYFPKTERELTAVGCVLLVDVSQAVLDTIDRSS